MFLAGQKVRASQLNELGGGSAGSGATPTGGYTPAAADTTATNSTTLVDAAGLAFDVAANATYAFHGWLLYNSPSAADLSIRPAVPAGASGRWSLMGAVYDQTPVADTQWHNLGNWLAADLGTSQAVSGTTDATTRMSALIHGVLTTSATPGQLKLQVAQRVANATPTVLRAGSWLRLVRLA